MPKHQADLEKWEDERIALCWKKATLHLAAPAARCRIGGAP